MLGRLWGVMLSEEFREALDRDLAIPQDLVEETGADSLAGVDGDDGATTVLVAKEMVAPSHAENAESGLRERRLEFTSRDARSTAHAAMVTR